MLDQNLHPGITSFPGNAVDDEAITAIRFGGKGANLMRMAGLGLPVPQGFVLETSLCSVFEAAGGKLPEAVWTQVLTALSELEDQSGRNFGRGPKPLLVSVRSGAPVSMPGMMDTVLNLGLTQDGVRALADETKDPRFAWDCYRRFVQMYANVVQGNPEPPVRVQHHLDDASILEPGGDARPKCRAQHACAAGRRLGFERGNGHDWPRDGSRDRSRRPLFGYAQQLRKRSSVIG